MGIGPRLFPVLRCKSAWFLKTDTLLKVELNSLFVPERYEENAVSYFWLVLICTRLYWHLCPTDAYRRVLDHRRLVLYS